MRALTLTQPYATAIASGTKLVETRSWRTAYRGDIAIHAAKTWTATDREFATVEHTLGRLPSVIPLGAIVAVAYLLHCQRSENAKRDVSAIERLYGNYDPGRWCWMFHNVRALREPVACSGKQGLWSVPPGVWAEVLSRLPPTKP